MTIGKKILFVFACLFFVLTLFAFAMTTDLYVGLRNGMTESPFGAIALAVVLVVFLVLLWSAAFIDILLSAFLCRAPLRFVRIAAIVFLVLDALQVLASFAYLILQ